jgi:hypothetical protein
MPRLALLLIALAAAAGCGADPERRAAPPPPAPADPGLTRYRAYVAAEAASLAERVSVRAFDDARVHAGRLAPVARATGALELLAVSRVDAAEAASLRRAALRTARDAPRVALSTAAVVGAAATALEGARGSRDLVDVGARVDGAAVAFDAVRDAVWERDKGLVGSIDDRLTALREELRRDGPDVRRLDARLHAVAWRLALAPAVASAG